MTPSDRRRTITGLLFVAPWLLGFLIFTVYPILASFYFSLCDYRVLSPPRFIGLGNYTAMLRDTDYFWRSVLNTAFMFIELPLALALSLGIAMLLNQRLKGIAFFRAIYYLPAVIPTVASAVLWRWLLNPEYGLINDFLTKLHLPRLGWLTDPVWSKPSFILMDLWTVGGGIVIYLAGLQGVPQHLYEAAQMDGANVWQQFRHVTLPMLSPVIFFNLIMGVIGTFQYFTQTFVMTNGGPDNSTLFYALYLFQNAFQFFRMGEACAMAWILFALTMGATWLVFKSSARWVYYEGGLK
ncbi:MAG: sugar ABC transporter permease [Abditibacteriales bacterium]|nr:sugar ABC transporter permease [Abditibacteriales bacterium]MDW8365017.1 sugar ABC transporter permease [Abditibacteriales bacterium]